jgi:hypothetical protein
MIFTTQNAPLPIPWKIKGNRVLHIIHFNDVTSVWNINRLCGKCGGYIPLSLQAAISLA